MNHISTHQPQQPRPSHGRRRRHALPQRRGVAMLLVLGVVVMGSVLGYAMLSSAAMTKQTSTNAAVTASAQGMAESGVNLAAYYLQNPDKAPNYPTTYADTPNWFWPGTNGQFIEMGSPAVGSIKVNVTRVTQNGRWRYLVDAVGRTPGNSLERSAKATLQVNSEYRVEHAAVFNNDATLPSNTRIGIAGTNVHDIYSNGALVIRTGAQVYGQGTRRRVTSTPVHPVATPRPAWKTPAPLLPKIVPAFADVRNYKKYEYPKGTEYNATTVAAGSTLGRGDVLAPSASNPAGVFYVPGNFTMQSG